MVNKVHRRKKIKPSFLIGFGCRHFDFSFLLSQWKIIKRNSCCCATVVFAGSLHGDFLTSDLIIRPYFSDLFIRAYVEFSEFSQYFEPPCSFCFMGDTEEEGDTDEEGTEEPEANLGVSEWTLKHDFCLFLFFSWCECLIWRLGIRGGTKWSTGATWVCDFSTFLSLFKNWRYFLHARCLVCRYGEALLPNGDRYKGE